MNEKVDLLVIGAGPAGMSAAIFARNYGLKVLVVDEQDAPGGQIWRGIEQASRAGNADVLGASYSKGKVVVDKFRSCGAEYRSNTRVWNIEPGLRVFITGAGVTSVVDTDYVLLATGAQERPVPFPGWTLPGVMTVGAGQIVLKSSGQVPADPVWIAGNGPLPLLYATQLLKAGGQIAGYLDTTPPGQLLRAMPRILNALTGAPMDIVKGLAWLMDLRRKANYVPSVTGIEVFGENRVERLDYITANGNKKTVEASLLLVHEGIVPTIHPTLSLGCEHEWDADQLSFAPKLDVWGESSQENVFVAGDGAGIGGVEAAQVRGQISALRVLIKNGNLSDREGEKLFRPMRSKLKRALAPRAFLDKLYRPRNAIFEPEDNTLVCRCEEVVASSIRHQAAMGHFQPDKIKALTRAGMGPCQGRQCNYTVAHILADATNRTVPDLGLYRVRPPFKPLTVDELASLADNGVDS